MIPIFPSVTFPNHYSIVTGLRADKHGIVANAFWDSSRNKSYNLTNRTNLNDGSWYKGEPLWVATTKEKMISASYFWVGSEANIQGIHPTYWYPYNREVPNRERVNQVLQWFRLPHETRPHFVTLYFSDIDTAGHRFGPESDRTKASVLKLDQELKYLFDGLKKIDLDINIIITSDHGMQKLNEKEVLYLTDYIDLNQDIRVEGRGTYYLFYIPNPSIRRETYNKLKKIPHVSIYKRGELSPKYGYNHPQRVGDLILSVHSPYYMKKTRTPSTGQKIAKGNHGYDPFVTKNMWGIFYARGPQILNKGKTPAFHNIHVYPFVMDLLGLEIKTEIDGERKVLAPYRKIQ